MNAKLLRGATLSFGAVATAALAVTFLPGGVAAAEPEDDLYWVPEGVTQTSQTTDLFGDTVTTDVGGLTGVNNPTDLSIVLSDELQANQTTTTIPLLGSLIATFDITSGDTVIPAGSTIDEEVNELFDSAAVTVVVPGAGLFGLPEITETIFTQFGDFSF